MSTSTKAGSISSHKGKSQQILNADNIPSICSKEDLLKLKEWKMPFGKFEDKSLIELPEAYLLWFQKEGFPKGKLGELLALCLELKIEGLDELIKSSKFK